jgi:hypothetical protein
MTWICTLSRDLECRPRPTRKRIAGHLQSEDAIDAAQGADVTYFPAKLTANEAFAAVTAFLSVQCILGSSAVNEMP